MNPLPEKKHFTAKECADAWGISVQDLLQYGAYGKIELMVYLELTEGIMYVFRKGKSPREEIKRSVWCEFQILSPMVCRDLQVHPDKPCPVTSIEPDQSFKKKYDSDDMLGIDLFQPFIENGERSYQMVTYENLWISIEEKTRFENSLNINITSNSFINNKRIDYRKSSHHLIIWEIHKDLSNKFNRQPTAREVWKELEQNHRFYDPDEITIGEITSEILEWYDNSGKKQFFKRVSLDGFLSKERKKQKNHEKT